MHCLAIVLFVLSLNIWVVVGSVLAQSQAPLSESQDNPGYLLELLKATREEVRLNPDNAKAHFRLAELLRKAGRHKEAAQEYLIVTELDSSSYLAFHQLSLVAADSSQLDEAIQRLFKLKEDNPKDLMLRIALSELFEKQGNFYQAARALIDMVYENTIPDKHRSKVNARIHFLLAKAKEAQSGEKIVNADEEFEVMPSPLPAVNLRKGLATSKIKESKEIKNVGHIPLIP